MAIAFCYSVGTGLGGAIGPLLFSRLVETGKLGAVASGYYLGAGLMIATGVVEIFFGVEAARRSLADVARPLTAEEPATAGAAPA